MAYSLENTSDLITLANVIRSKTGESGTMTVAEMATAVNGISTSSIDTSPFNFSGRSANNLFMKTNWTPLLNTYGYLFNLTNLTACNYMFNETDITTQAGSLNVSTSGTCAYMFYKNYYMTELPTMNITPTTVAGMFMQCCSLKTIPANKLNINWNSLHSSTNNFSQMFYNCYCLRSIPSSILENLYSSATGSLYGNTFYNCNNLEEIENFSVGDSTTYTNNRFQTTTFQYCGRLKKFTFKKNGNSVYSRNWSNQTIDLSSFVGWLNGIGNISTYGGLEDPKWVKDDATYNLYKNDPDYFTNDVKYSRYNKLSAIETINSLPNVSAGSSNVIKFKGIAGSKTDGGAINTMTTAQKAVATNKGWTITFV